MVIDSAENDENCYSIISAVRFVHCFSCLSFQHDLPFSAELSEYGDARNTVAVDQKLFAVEARRCGNLLHLYQEVTVCHLNLYCHMLN